MNTTYDYISPDKNYPPASKQELSGNRSNTSLVGTLLTIGSLGVGAYHGFCDAQGIPLTPGVENGLTYAPLAVGAVLSGTTGALTGGLVGTVIGGTAGGMAGAGAKGGLGALVGGTAGGAAGGLSGAAVGGTIGAVGGGLLRGIQTLVGYGCGYVAGALFR